MTAPATAPAAEAARVSVDAAALHPLEVMLCSDRDLTAAEWRDAAEAMLATAAPLPPAPAVPSVDRAAFECALDALIEAVGGDYPSDRETAARAALLALVFPDALAHDADAAGENGGGR